MQIYTNLKNKKVKSYIAEIEYKINTFDYEINDWIKEAIYMAIIHMTKNAVCMEHKWDVLSFLKD